VAVIRSARIPVFWGIAGFAVGLIIASQLAWPALNFDLPWTTFGRLWPLHTSAVIFAFGGNPDRDLVLCGGKNLSHATQRPEIKAARHHPHCCFCFRG